MFNPFFVIDAVATLKAHQEQARLFNEYLKSIPQEEADKLRAERKKLFDEERQHQRNLEVAREGRNLNFWGNR